MNKRITRSSLVSGIAAASLCMASAADARDLKFASGVHAGSMGAVAVEAYADAVEEHSNGKLTVTTYLQSLLSFMETPDGLRDGMADLGTVLVAYFPSDFPTTTMFTELTMNLPLQDADPRESTFAYSAAAADFVINHCDACMDEHLDKNQIYLGMVGTTPYGLFCTTPIKSAEDLAGKRIRIGGPQWSRWVTEFGGSPVSIPVNETYEALNQGVVDCTAHNLPDLINFKFIDIVSDITMGVPGSTFGGVGTNINTDAWRSLSAEERKSVLYGAAVINAELAMQYHEEHEEALRQLAERSDEITMHEPEASFQAETRAFQKADLATIPQRYAERYGIENAEELSAAFTEVLAEWMDRVSDVHTREQLVALYWDEIFSKIDVNSYGM